MFKVVQSLCAVCSRVLQQPHVAKSSNIWKARFQQHRNFSMSVSVSNQEPKLNISDACVKQMKKVVTRDEFLRVIVEGGGCSGFQYKFELDSESQEDDRC
uniref:Iron-sulfur cluster assembly 2 homolog, mitochondrial-like n=1 Tax=Phallusia mammillata TaxID=59560 RepID=A0A6F9DET6_9ASCI|nr:iron-sulfur cluster assembly 2 homolog, mitochondrial-like [Phallusia mammillata]